MKVFYPPEQFTITQQSIFLAGSIENGSAEDWQQKVIDSLSDLDIAIINPRRKDWDSSWEQSITNGYFVEQVNWELDSLSEVDTILFYFQSGTVSPISLMELGLHINSDRNLVVCCPEGYFRKGNIDILCQRNNIPVFTDLDSAIEHFKYQYYAW